MIRKSEKNSKMATAPAPDRTTKITKLQRDAQQRELRIIAALSRAQKHSSDPMLSRKNIATEMGITESQLSRLLNITSVSRAQATLFQLLILCNLLGYSIDMKTKREDDAGDINGSGMEEEKLLMGGDPKMVIKELMEALRHERETTKFIQNLMRDLKRENETLKKSLAHPEDSGSGCAAMG